MPAARPARWPVSRQFDPAERRRSASPGARQARSPRSEAVARWASMSWILRPQPVTRLAARWAAWPARPSDRHRFRRDAAGLDAVSRSPARAGREAPHHSPGHPRRRRVSRWISAATKAWARVPAPEPEPEPRRGRAPWPAGSRPAAQRPRGLRRRRSPASRCSPHGPSRPRTGSRWKPSRGSGRRTCIGGPWQRAVAPVPSSVPAWRPRPAAWCRSASRPSGCRPRPAQPPMRQGTHFRPRDECTNRGDDDGRDAIERGVEIGHRACRVIARASVVKGRCQRSPQREAGGRVRGAHQFHPRQLANHDLRRKDLDAAQQVAADGGAARIGEAGVGMQERPAVP